MEAGYHARTAIGQLPENAQRVDLVLWIQVVGRLIEQLDVGRLSQDLGNGKSAALSARKRQDVAIC